MKKPLKIVFIEDNLEETFYALPKNDFLKKALVRAIKDLQENAFCGIQIPKRLIPKMYVRKYALTNMWKYDLPKGGDYSTL